MTESHTTTKVQLKDGVYDPLKKVVQVVLPGFGALYFTLAQIWGLPAADQVVGTCSAVALFLGLLLTLSSKNYNADNNEVVGVVEVSPTEDGRKRYSVNFEQDPETWEGKKSVQFTIDNKL